MRRALVAALVSVLAWCAAAAADPLLLIRVGRKAQDDLTRLRTERVPVVMETLPCLFVLGGEADLAHLKERGYDARVLDRDAAKADYYMIGVRPDSDVAAVRAAGAVLLEEENWVMLRVPDGSSLHAVGAARVFVGRVPEEPAGIPQPPPATAPGFSSLLPNPIVQKVVATVADASIQAYWQALAANPPTGTRFSTNQGCRDAATYCYNAYAAYNVQAQYQNWSGTHAPNVIGTIEGVTAPGNVYILEAHLDDLPSSGTAPGADDNASGSAAVLEAGKALSCWGVRNTVKFLNVTGEENGLLGSAAYAADAALRGEKIGGVINFDMIGWEGNGSPSTENLDLNYNAASQWLSQRFVDAAAAYGTGLSVNPILCPSLTVSDHYPFWQRGWSAICGITDNEGFCGAAGNYPFYHQSTDTIAHNGNPAFFYKVVKTAVATLAELADPFKITFEKNTYACGAPVKVILADRDLNTAPGTAETVAVVVTSNSEPAGEILTLTERGVNAMLFDGSLPTTSTPPVASDGVLTITAGDSVSVEYVDAVDCGGATNVTYTATAGTDCVFPVISGVTATVLSGSSASIGWATDEAATSVVHYGTSPPGPEAASNASLVSAHAVVLSGLAACTPYIFWVESADAVGNRTTNDAAGAYYAFTTGLDTTPSFSSADTPLNIPDANATGVTSTITVSDDKIVEDVNVRVNITHPFDADLSISLIPPVGAPIPLSTGRGNNGDDFVNTVFDDQAQASIGSGSAPFTGSFRPESPLGAVNGIHAVGVWRLKIVDGGFSDVGSLSNWTLMLNYPFAQCPTPPPPVPDGTFGTPMTATRLAADGSSMGLSWDVATCAAPGYKLLYGALDNVSAATVDGAVCSVGTSGSSVWNGVPTGDLWYVVVATDGAGTEGAWGSAAGAGASGQCGDTLRNDSGSCP